MDLKSKGNTTILTIVDRFPKLVHVVLFGKLPSPKELAVKVTKHVFCLHDLPQNTPLDRGPQFVTTFLSELCERCGSGFHFQNQQVESYNQDLETTF